MITFFKHKKHIGMGVNPHSITLAEFNKKGRVLNYLGEIPYRAQESFQAFEKIGKEICSRVAKNHWVTMSIPSVKIMKKIICLNKALTVNDVATYVKWEGKKHFPEATEELYFDFSFDCHQEESQEMMIHLFAVKKT